MKHIDKTVISKLPPRSKEVMWLDASEENSDAQLKAFINGKWQPVVSNGGGSGSTGSMIEITYSQLKSLRDNSNLSPGCYYRIIDYQCTTTQEGTQSAGHQFDIIVRSDDKYALNENAFAIEHEGDTYFQNADLSAWELKYCLDNDTNRFEWADPTNGKGVIYYMKDEWDNIAPFDFKNMLFTRNTEWFGDHETWAEDVLGGIPDTDLHFYFLSWVTEDGEIQDASIVGQTLQNDEGAYSGVFGNKIKETSAYGMGIAEGATSFTFVLPCTIIVSSYSYEGGLFYGCYNNTFWNNCYSNTFGNNCYNNTFGDNCYRNTFGNGCEHTIFGNYCSGNTFRNDCYRIIFGNYCNENTFDSNSSSNTFGNYCINNTFGNNCASNTFGTNCGNNTFGNSCNNNTFGNNCASNTFGDSCQNNTFGNDCRYNTFGSSAQSLKSYFENIIFENGNININLTCSQTTSSSNKCRNVLVSLGVNNSTTAKTITINSVKQTNRTVVRAAADTEITV